MTTPISKKDAIDRLSDGHAIWSVQGAKTICEALGIEYNDKLEEVFHNQPGVYKGAEIPPEKEGNKGIDDLRLAGYIASKLGISDKVGGFLGRGFQAREYARVIDEYFKQKEVNNASNIT